MKVQFLKSCITVCGAFKKGVVSNFSDSLAASLCAMGVAKPYEAPAKKAASKAKKEAPDEELNTEESNTEEAE